MTDYLPIVGTLSGTLVGALAGYAGQWMQAKRAEHRQLLDMRRALYADFMGATHDLFETTRQCYRDHPNHDMDSRPELRRALACVSTGSCRRGIDQIRIVADGYTVLRAEELMHHLRNSAIVEGSADSTKLRRWINGYWVARHALIYGVREELGVGTASFGSLDKGDERLSPEAAADR